jgi:hypothetical protein
LIKVRKSVMKTLLESTFKLEKKRQGQDSNLRTPEGLD